MIAWLGTGLLGGNFVRALRKRGEDVHVWNRSVDKARALEDSGARVFADPAEAVAGATRVHLTLSDDQAVDDVLVRVRGGLSPDAIIVDHTTTSVSGTAARAKRWAGELGTAFQHAPVFMGPQNAHDSTGVMLASGSRKQFDTLQPELAKMTGKLHYLSAAPERAAAFKLMGNLFLMHFTVGISELIALGTALGVAPSDATTLFELFDPTPMLKGRAKRIVDGDFSHPSWELAMARKDARLMLDEAHGALHVLPAIAAWMDAWIARGHGHDDWTVIAKDGLVR